MRQARYLDPEHTSIEVTEDDGRVFVVPVAPGNRHYIELTESDPIAIADYVPPAVTDADVDAEVDRRAHQAVLDAEREKLKPAADDLKRRIKAGERVDIKADAEWALV